MMLKKFQNNMESLDVIYLGGERMGVKERKEGVDQPIFKWSPSCMTK